MNKNDNLREKHLITIRLNKPLGISVQKRSYMNFSQ
jgi:hypothetical protein